MFILTHSGKRFHYDNPDPSAILIEDIAHALAHVNRFTGQTRLPSSVAQHSIAVADYLAHAGAPTEIILGGLTHDAHEAYFGDIPSPLKLYLGIREKEKQVQKAVLSALAIPMDWVLDTRVKEADLISLAAERHALLAEDPMGEDGWDTMPGITLAMRDRMLAISGLGQLRNAGQLLTPAESSKQFLMRYHALRAEIMLNA